jgi:hypothetical protein
MRRTTRSGTGDVILTVVTSIFALLAIGVALLGLRFLLGA